MKSYLIILFLFLPLFSFGNTPNDAYQAEDLTTKTIDKADWEKATEGLDYGEAKRVEPKKRQKIEGAEFIGTFLKIIGVLCAIVLIVFLLRSFVGLQGVQTGKSKTFDPNEKIDTQTVAEHIHEFDLPTLIQQAIQQGDYVGATRLYYLLTIKTLSDKQLIQWKKDKTNRTYLNELSDTNLRKPFRELTNIFERVWYGEATIDASIFGNIEQQFKGFLGTMNKEVSAKTGLNKE